MSDQKSTDKPLGDAGSGASGGGSLGNMPGPGAPTGGDPKQGVRAPSESEIEPKDKRLDQHSHQTAEVPHRTSDKPGPSSSDEIESHDAADNVTRKGGGPLKEN